ncbi:glycerophosphodiester phosphodiesterase family protein [Reichenbachiella sp. MALMAid0571]|uniref:glycerophosphodiester phosphodiesterase family protein n=1 Tax=Reichenbachiella sp. MALMAid0571 TaxID=3143939 RepID=UPI0032DF5C2E
MIRLSILLFFVCLFFISLNSCSPKTDKIVNQTDIQGHRGARGLMPENTIPAFLEALKLGVTTLELDLAVTKDNELVVSHEPYFSSTYCLDSTGKEIPKDKEDLYNIYQMSYEEVKAFDCGTKPHSGFPEQQKFKVKKPLLKDVVEAVNVFLDGKKVKYNIEIKSTPKGDGIFHPSVEVFSDLVYNFIQKNIDPKYVNVQSFDFRILKYFNQKYPEIELAVLVGNDHVVDDTLEELGFVPDIYSCGYKNLTAEVVKEIHDKKMKVIPWTINETKDMERIIGYDVDGIITDYPDRAMKLVKM